MSEVEFKVGGKKVSQREFSKAIKQQGLDALARGVEKLLRGKVCPVHGVPPKVKFIATSGRARPEVTTCCKEFGRSVQVSLR